MTPYVRFTVHEAISDLAGRNPDTVVALDLETYGVRRHEDALDPRAGRIRLVGYQPFPFRGREGEPNTESVRLVDVRGEPEADIDALLAWLARFRLVAHNAHFDLGWFFARGIWPERTVYDTLSLAQLVLAGERSRAGYHCCKSPSLENCARYFLGENLDKSEQTSEWSRPELTAEQLDYAATDVAVLIPLFRRLSDHVARRNLARAAGIEMQAVAPMAWITAQGMPFDAELWNVPYRQAEANREALYLRLRQEYLTDDRLPAVKQARHPQRGNQRGQVLLPYARDERVDAILASAGQLKEFLGQYLGRGIPSTDDDTLAELDHPLCELIRDWREANTILTRFGPTWGRVKNVNQQLPAVRHGRLFPKIKQNEAITGRMSYSYPNLQQVPSPGKHPLGTAFRRAFAAPRGRELVLADFSQVELRIAAQVSGDRAMREVYERNGDIHTEAAGWVLGVPEPTRHHRTIMKSANFGLLYGAGTARFRAYARAYFGLRLTLEQAEQIRNGWFLAFPGIRSWHRHVGGEIDRADKDGLTTRTLSGRQVMGVTKYSDALNYPVQGSGADLIKMALARIYADKANAPVVATTAYTAGGWFPVGVVHDEIILEVPEGSGQAMGEWLHGHMVAAGRELLEDVPVEADVSVHKSWGK